MREYLRFLFSAHELGFINDTNMIVQDADFSNFSNTALPYPQSLILQFNLFNVEEKPQVLPLLPGRLTYISDASPEVLNGLNAETLALDTENQRAEVYSSWATQGITKGTLMVNVDSKELRKLKKVLKEEGERTRNFLELPPNRLWYGPIEITPDFLFNKLIQRLPKLRAGNVRPNIKLRDGSRRPNPRWPAEVIVRFLKGIYNPKLRSSDIPEDSDFGAVSMPTVHTLDGNVQLVVTVAHARAPYDAPKIELDNVTFDVKDNSPFHAVNGAIPARRVYRYLRSELTHADPDNPVVNRVLAEWPFAPRYFPVRVTRTWEPREDCSHLFPRSEAVLTDKKINHESRVRMPSHGMLFYSQDAPAVPELEETLPTPFPSLEVKLESNWDFYVDRWTYLDGAIANSWQVNASPDPITFEIELNTPPVPVLPTPVVPHLIVRRTMEKDMFPEAGTSVDYPTGNGALCTYYSMRRTVRALVDHRITGGRLWYTTQSGANKGTTYGMINRAWKNLEASARIVRNNKPPVGGPSEKALTIIPVLRAFAPGEETCTPDDPEDFDSFTLTKGLWAYFIWQNIRFRNKREDFIVECYQESHYGAGGAGAMDMMDLATSEPMIFRTKSDGLPLIKQALTPGAVVQCWFKEDRFNGFDDKDVLLEYDRGNQWNGHSFVFFDYLRDNNNNVEGFQIIDQNGLSFCTIDETNKVIKWGEENTEVWVACNWSE